MTKGRTPLIPKNRIPTHPGEILLKEFLAPRAITQTALAAHLKMSVQRINEVINGKRHITHEMACLLATTLDTTSEFWMNLQTRATSSERRVHVAKPHLQKDQIAMLVREYRGGAAVPALAVRFSVTPPTIYRWLEAKKVRLRATKGYAGKLDEAQVAEIVREYKSGSTSSLLAARLGVAATTICYWLRIKKVATRAATKVRLRADQIAKSVRAYKSGTSVALLATRFGVSGHTIYHWLRTNKVVLTSATALAPRLREDQVAEIVQAYKNGTSTPLLAARFGVSPSAISHWLRVKKVVTRTGAPPRLASYDVLCADYLSGLTQAQVADKHNVSVPTVCRVLKLRGIAVRPRPRGPVHPLWKGGRHIGSDQYMIADGKREHRTIMEQLLGRALRHWEDVHHVDGDKLNATHDNLVVLSKREHARFHSTLRAHGLPVSRESLERLCRLEGPFYFRFTVADARDSGLGRGRYHESRRSKCRFKGCGGLRYGQGLCNKHWQRKRARDRGFWQGADGKCTVFRGKFTRTKRAAAKALMKQEATV